MIAVSVTHRVTVTDVETSESAGFSRFYIDTKEPVDTSVRIAA